MKNLKNRNPKKTSLKNKTREAWCTLCTAAFSGLMAVNAFATETGSSDGGEFAKSKFATGFLNLISDVTFVALFACPAVGALVAIFFLIRRSMADETDGKMWNKRIITAIICGVGGGLVAGIISLVSGYFA